MMFKRKLAAAVGAMAMLGGTAAAGPSASASESLYATYTISRSAATYLSAGNNLFPGGADDAVTQIALPFPVHIYGTRRTTAWVSTNGNVQFGNFGVINFVNNCLPSSSFGDAGPVVAPYWDDVLIRANPGSPDGVFTKTYGRSPNRKFVISWRGVDFATQTVAVRFEVVFYQGKRYFDFIYADGDGYDATIGVQNWARSSSTQFLCNPGRHNVVTPGERLRFTYTVT